MSRPIVKIPVKSGDVALIPGDLHGGVQDDDVLDLLWDVALAAQASRLILVGDNMNMGSISRHPRPARQKLDMPRLADEDGELAPWVQGLRADGLEVWALAGNHEQWLQDHIDANPALYGTLEWWTPFPLTYEGAKLAPIHGMFQAGRLVIDHGHLRAGMRMGGGKRPASTMLANYPGMNILFGHVHRIDECTTPTEKYNRQVLHGAWAVGHCSRPEEHIHYAGGAQDSWTQGGAIVSWHQSGGDLYHQVELLRVFRLGKSGRGRPAVMFRGRIYK